jgi:hypothetical protein
LAKIVKKVDLTTHASTLATDTSKLVRNLSSIENISEPIPVEIVIHIIEN